MIAWTGEFTDRVAEAAYAATRREDARAAALLCVIATSLTSIVFVPMDLMMIEGSRLPFFLGVRTVIALMGLTATLALVRVRTLRRIIRIAYLQQYAFFGWNALVFAHPVLDRHGGVFFPLISIALWMCLPGSFRAAATLCLFAPLVSLIFWGVLGPHPNQPMDLVILGMLTVTAYLIGGAARIQFNRMRRDQHLHIQRERRANLKLAEAKRQAEDTARARADFLAVMSHEIRTPMNAILGMVGLLARDRPTADQARRLGIIADAGRRLVHLCDDVLDLSRFEAGTLALALEPVDLAAMAADIVELMRPSATQKGLALTLDCGTLGSCYALDPLRLQQVMFNLLANAVKFTERGEVRVSLWAGTGEAGRDWITLQVEDTGPGIPDEAKPTVFHAFRQYRLTGRERGAGLGLAIVSGLARSMGGTVGVTDRPGGGARFTLTFPAIPSLAPAPIEAAMLPELQPLDILVVEDAPENQQVMRELLEPLGHRLAFLDDGAEVCRLLTERHFDVVLMDIRLAEVDGMEATRRIRRLADAETAMTPVIAVTANVAARDEAAYLDAGIDELLAKPIDPEQLLDALARHAPAAGRPPALPEPPLGSRSGDRAAALFAAACREQTDALASAAAAGDRQRLGAIAHRLKGSAATFGAAPLARAAAALLEAVDNGGADDALPVAELRHELAAYGETQQDRS